MVNENLTPTPATQWKGKVQVEGADVELPSGNVARVKQLSPQAFLASGLIPDPLSAIIRKAINSKQGLPPKAVEALTDDPKKLNDALELFDRVTAFVVVEPQVLMPPKCTVCKEYFNVDARHSDNNRDDYHTYNEGPRNPDLLYVDQVDMQDKMYIFEWCLGSVKSLEPFRQQDA